jgi:ribosomal protein S18 acetylase RimI-like enzyme
MTREGYERPLDLLAVGPEGRLVAFCICAADEDDPKIGYTDPIGTHVDYRGLGLGTAIVTAGMGMLKERGVTAVFFGTSSENVAMQRLGEGLGFRCISEKIWFSRKVEN